MLKALQFFFIKESPSIHTDIRKKVDGLNDVLHVRCFTFHTFFWFIYLWSITHQKNGMKSMKEGKKREWNIFYGCIHNYPFCSMSFVCKHIRYTDIESQGNFFCCRCFDRTVWLLRISYHQLIMRSFRKKSYWKWW